MSHAQIKRFDFGSLTDFFAPAEPEPTPEEVQEAQQRAEEQEAPPPPPPPTFSEAELEEAKNEAFEAGKQAGFHEEAKRQESESKQREIAIDAACRTIAMEVVQIHAGYRQAMLNQSQALSALVLQCARRVAGDAVAEQPVSGIETMVLQCLDALHSQPKIQLFVHESLVDILQDRLNLRLKQQKSDCTITVEAKAGLEPGDAKLQWENGSAMRDQAAIWQQIDTIINQQNFAPMIEESFDAAPEQEETSSESEGENNE
tara:strand:- start:520 stop:1296 length:777 start_codon:yes stop_codon:yes gene_type:complete